MIISNDFHCYVVNANGTHQTRKTVVTSSYILAQLVIPLV